MKQNMYHDSIFQESPIQAYQHHRVANANRFYRDTTRDNRLKRTPYDVPMSQSQNAMDVCSQQNRSKKSSRTEGGVISRVANSIKDTIVGLAKDFIYGTQQQSDSEEEEKEEKVKTQPHMQIDQQEISFNGKRELEIPTIHLGQIRYSNLQPSPLLKNPKSRDNNKTSDSTGVTSFEQLLNEDSLMQNKSEGFERISYANILQSTRDHERLIERKHMSIWQKFNYRQFKHSHLPNRYRNKGLEAVRIIANNTPKQLLTADNRNPALGIMKLRKDKTLVKPIVLKPPTEQPLFAKKRDNVFRPIQQMPQKKMKVSDQVERKVVVKDINQRLETGKLKNELSKAMTIQEMEEFKRGVQQSKIKAVEANDPSYLQDFINQQVRRYQPKIIDQQLKTAERNLKSNGFTQEEKRHFNMQIQELKRLQEELLMLEQKKIDEIKELKEMQKKSQTELLETVLKEMADKALETQEKLQNSLANSQQMSQSMMMSQTQDMAFKEVKDDIQQLCKTIDTLSTGQVHVMQAIQKLQLPKTVNEFSSASTKEEKKEELKVSDNNRIITPGQNEKKVEFKTIDIKKAESADASKQILKQDSNQKLVSFGDKSEKQDDQSDISSFKSERLSTPSPKSQAAQDQPPNQSPLNIPQLKLSTNKVPPIITQQSATITKSADAPVTKFQFIANLGNNTSAPSQPVGLNPFIASSNTTSAPNPFILPAASNASLSTSNNPFTNFQSQAPKLQANNPFLNTTTPPATTSAQAAPSYQFKAIQPALLQNQDNTMQVETAPSNSFTNTFKQNAATSFNTSNQTSGNPFPFASQNNAPSNPFQFTNNNNALKPNSPFQVGQSQQPQHQQNQPQFNIPFAKPSNQGPNNMFSSSQAPTPAFQSSPFSNNAPAQNQFKSPFANSNPTSTSPFSQSANVNSAAGHRQPQSQEVSFTLGGGKKNQASNEEDDGLFAEKRTMYKAVRNQPRR